MRRLVIAALVAGSIASVAPSSSAAVLGPDRSTMRCVGQARQIMRQNDMEVVSLKSLHIEAATAKKSYRLGEIAKFPVVVTRPAENDPLGQGIPMDRPMVEPAANVNIGVGLLIGEVFLPGFAVTDENGEALIKVKIEKYVKPSVAHGSFYTWNVIQDTPCLKLEESGFLPIQNFFTVTK